MKVLSLFDGISCGRVALQRAGIPVSRYVAYEIDKNAINCSAWNWPDIEHRGSVVGADFTEFAGFDLVMGGFPCTDLSIGKPGREGLKGEHSSLFWEQVRAIREVNPRYYLVENNYRMPKKDEAIITETLGVRPIHINSALVSAQNRNRLYWTNIPGIEQPENRGLPLADVLEENTPLRYYYSQKGVDYAIRSERNIGFFQFGSNAKSKCVIASYGSCGSGLNYLVKSQCVIANYHKGSPYNSLVCPKIKDVGGFSVVNGTLPSGVRISLPDGDYVLRKLTPVECERLQTLPDHYTDMLPETQRYKTVGNGWTVNTIAHIFNYMTLDTLL